MIQKWRVIFNPRALTENPSRFSSPGRNERNPLRTVSSMATAAVGSSFPELSLELARGSGDS